MAINQSFLKNKSQIILLYSWLTQWKPNIIKCSIFLLYSRLQNENQNNMWIWPSFTFFPPAFHYWQLKPPKSFFKWIFVFESLFLTKWKPKYSKILNHPSIYIFASQWKPYIWIWQFFLSMIENIQNHFFFILNFILAKWNPKYNKVFIHSSIYIYLASQWKPKYNKIFNHPSIFLGTQWNPNI
jgi:hypothetical protein